MNGAHPEGRDSRSSREAGIHARARARLSSPDLLSSLPENSLSRSRAVSALPDAEVA